nr:hypothetical protein [Methanobrevibacter arboriphilus]
MRMNNNDLNILNQIIEERNVKYRTYHAYKSSLKNYLKFQNISFEELLKEAKEEQDSKIPWYDRTIVERLTKYRKYLYNTFNGSTASRRLSNIIRLYKDSKVEMGELPYFNEKNANYSDPITFDDLATLEELKEGLNIAPPIMRAIILFMLSSACAKVDTLNIKVIDFLEATSKYHNINTYIKEDIEDKFKQENKIVNNIICVLLEKNRMIPTFRLKRQKTSKYFTTYCSPEATNAIVSYLISLKEELNYNDNLFKINERYFNDKFKEINDKLDRFKQRKTKKFTSHMLRKMNASLLYKNNYFVYSDEYKIALDKEQIEALHGRSKGSTEASYYKDNPEILKMIYINALPLITVFHEYTNKELEDMVNSEAEKKANKKTKAIQKELDEKNKSEKVMKKEIDDLKKTQNLILEKLSS